MSTSDEEEMTYIVPQLTANNFVEWDTFINIAIEARGLDELLSSWVKPEDTPENKTEIGEWKKANGKLKEMILHSSRDHAPGIIYLSTGKEMYEEVVRLNKRVRGTTPADILSKMSALKWEKNETASTYYSKQNALLHKYLNAGGIPKLGNGIMLLQLKRKAPEKLQEYIRIYVATHAEQQKEEKTEEFVRGLLRYEKELPVTVREEIKTKTEALSGTKGKNVTCFLCKKKGHVKNECWFHPSNKDKRPIRKSKDYHETKKRT